MQKNHIGKILTIFVILIFVCVSIHPVVAINSNEKDIQDENKLIKQCIKGRVTLNNYQQGRDKILAFNKASGDIFGRSVSIDGDYAIIGAMKADAKGEESGCAYIFKRSGLKWSLQQKLIASDAASSDWFGCSVSINGNYAIIGARCDDDNGHNSGSAYIFARSGTHWFEQQKILASDGINTDCFGWSVSMDGEYALIGAILDTDNGWDSGSAYVFKRDGTTWTEQAKLLASDGAEHDYFGWSVSMDGEYAIIGSYGDNVNGENSGSAYVFKREGTIWSEQDKLIPSDGKAEDVFGCSVSIDGEYAIIGAVWSDDNGKDSGSAYVFKRDDITWVEQQKLTASDGASDDWFGYSVSIDGVYAIIGTPADFNYENSSGSAYIFKRSGTTWSEQQELLELEGGIRDRFGYYVSINGDYAIIGVPYDDDNGPNSGSAYIYKLIGSIWFKQDKLIISRYRSSIKYNQFRFIDIFPNFQRILNIFL